MATTPSLALVVQHHPARAGRVHRLIESCGDSWRSVTIVTDIGTGPAEPWRTYRQCLTADVGDRVILQDDALVPEGFDVACQRIAESQPGRMVCLYHGRHPHHSYQQMIRAAEHCERYAEIEPTQWVPLVGTIWPAEMAERCAEDVGNPAIRYADDGLVARWMHKQRVLPLVAIPNIVQHDDTERTLMRATHVRSNRGAACWIGDTDPLTYDW